MEKIELRPTRRMNQTGELMRFAGNAVQALYIYGPLIIHNGHLKKILHIFAFRSGNFDLLGPYPIPLCYSLEEWAN